MTLSELEKLELRRLILADPGRAALILQGLNRCRQRLKSWGSENPEARSAVSRANMAEVRGQRAEHPEWEQNRLEGIREAGERRAEDGSAKQQWAMNRAKHRHLQPCPDYWAAREWFFKDPSGVPRHAKNLRHYIRENAQLFNPEDVVWKSTPKGITYCNATQGLSALSPHKKTVVWSWKGWTWDFEASPATQPPV